MSDLKAPLAKKAKFSLYRIEKTDSVLGPEAKSSCKTALSPPVEVRYFVFRMICYIALA